MGRKWEGRTRGGPFGYMFFILLVRIAGIWAAYAFLSLVVLYFIPFAPSQTRSCRMYARRILGMGKFRAALFPVRSYYAFGQSIIDRVVSSMGMRDRFGYSFDGHGKIMEYVRSGTGCIVIGAHVGSWQMGAQFFAPNGAKVNVAMYDNEYRNIKKVLERNTDQCQFNVIPVNEEDWSFLISITSAVRNGELVCFQGDRYMKEDRVFRAEFLGHEAEFPAGPFILAARLGCPVVFYYAMRGRGRNYRFIFRTPGMELADRGDMKEEEYIFRAYVASLESVVREYPEQWFNYYDFWNLYLSR